MTHFTLFVVLPLQEICSLRSLPSGTTIRDVRNRLEMAAGLPGQVYKLTSSNGQVLHEECELIVGQNVWDGFIVRVQLLNSWQPMYDAVTSGDVDWLLRNGAISMTQVDEDDVDKSQVYDVVEERGAVALYLASWRGSDHTCQALLSAGVNPNGRTPFRRTAIFAAVAKDNDRVLEVLLKHGAKTSVKDYNGETALDVARRGFSRLCVNVLRSFQLRNGGTLVPSRSNGVTLSSPRSRSPGSSCNLSFHQHGGRGQSEDDHSPRGDREVTSGNCPRTKKVNGIFRPRSGVSTSSSTARRVKFHDEVLNVRLNICNGDPTTPEAHRQKYSKPSLRNQQTLPQGQSIIPRTPNAAQLRVAVPSPRKPLELSNVITWNEGQCLDSEFLTVRSAFREGKVSVPVKTYGQMYAPEQDILSDTTNAGDHSLGDSFSASNFNENNHRSSEAAEINVSMTSLRIDDASSLTNDSTSSMKDADSRSVTSDPKVTNGRVSSARSCPGSLGTIQRPKLSTRIGSSPPFGRNKKRKETSKSLDDTKRAKVRIHLAEQSKRQSTAALKRAESFEKWLHRKRQQETNDSGSSDSASESDGDSDEKNDAAFNSWLKKVRERPKSRTSHQTPGKFDPRKPQSVQGLVGMASVPARRPTGISEVSSYVNEFKAWKKRQSHNTDVCRTLDADEAKRRLEEKRQQLLAMAITFDEWMAHAEERKVMLEVILKADEQRLDEIKKMNFAKRLEKNISFQQWRQKLEKRERLQRAFNLRMRIEEAREGQRNATSRSSAAITHDEWLSRQRLQGADGRQNTRHS
ncbi:unnamed protein product [Lymnaea stagnalis]|uniref:Uncharacterized protein n=1 Tax=Lymnaea stagnalis TaxID=6523 RepID=A0AAV2I2M5_LYMST